jgi:hypothetical protein
MTSAAVVAVVAAPARGVGEICVALSGRRGRAQLETVPFTAASDERPQPVWPATLTAVFPACLVSDRELHRAQQQGRMGLSDPNHCNRSGGRKKRA